MSTGSGVNFHFGEIPYSPFIRAVWFRSMPKVPPTISSTLEPSVQKLLF